MENSTDQYAEIKKGKKEIKQRRNYSVLIVVMLVAFLLIVSLNHKNKELPQQILPSLPQPIAKEMILITSAGQSTDTYIVKDIANTLKIHNYFMPKATSEDLEEINTIVFVVGYSQINEKLYSLDFEQEFQRIENLIDEAKRLNMSMITVFIGGEYRKDEHSIALLEMTSAVSDYIIATDNGTDNLTVYSIAKQNQIPLTIVESLGDLSEPFASAFR